VALTPMQDIQKTRNQKKQINIYTSLHRKSWAEKLNYNYNYA